MKHSLIALATLGLLIVGQPANAADISATCRSSGQVGELITCDTRKDFSFHSNGEDKEYSLFIRASEGHCSDVKFTIYSYNNRIIMGETDWLAPGQQGYAVIGGGMAEGTQIVKVRADGRLGGCNTGRLGSWKANVRAWEIE